jgi:hypothetical protein
MTVPAPQAQSATARGIALMLTAVGVFALMDAACCWPHIRLQVTGRYGVCGCRCLAHVAMRGHEQAAATLMAPAAPDHPTMPVIYW